MAIRQICKKKSLLAMSRSLASCYKCQEENLLHVFRWLMQDKGLEYVERKAEISHSHILLKFNCACLLQEEPRGRYFGLLKIVTLITRKTLVKYKYNLRKQASDLNFLGNKRTKKRKEETKTGFAEKDFCLSFVSN